MKCYSITSQKIDWIVHTNFGNEISVLVVQNGLLHMLLLCKIYIRYILFNKLYYIFIYV